MKDVIVSLGVATVGCVIYHAGQKAIPPTVNPMLILLGVYGAAILMALLAIPLFRQPGEAGSVGQVLSWPVLAVGVGVILIEGGFLLAYRSGGSLQWSGVAVNGLAAVALVPIAVFIFRERFSFARALGILLTLAGMALIARK